MFIVGLIVGLFCGALLGVFFICLLVASGRTEPPESEEHNVPKA